MINFSFWAIIGITAGLGIIFTINLYFYDRRKRHDNRQKKYESFKLLYIVNNAKTINGKPADQFYCEISDAFYNSGNSNE